VDMSESMKKNIESLFQFPSPFLNAPDSLISLIISQGEYKSVMNGKRIYSSGEISEGFYGVLEGKIRLSKITLKGDTHIIRDFHAGEWLGFISYFASMNSPHCATAIELSKVIYLPKSVIDQIYELFPHCYQSTLKLVSSAFVRLADHHIHAVHSPLIVRVSKVLLMINTLTETSELKLSQADIAAFVGATREAISIQLKLLESQGVIKIGYRKLNLIDNEKLFALANGEYYL